ncbi:MAG: hypothetical protein SFY81_04975 [Verrucomicrobiota bacterium]|nr:hypothetical protein [Verrucomicrobiota bacterium]
MSKDQKKPTPLLTAQDIDQGYKTIQVETLAGELINLKLNSVPWRKRQELTLSYNATFDSFIFVQATLDHSTPEALMNNLDAASVNKVIETATALVMGVSHQKKIAAIAAQLMETSGSRGGVLNAA